MKLSSFFCDDIRHEADGRRSFIGVYSSSTVVSKFPQLYPKLCLFLEVELRHGDEVLKGEIVISDGEREIARLDATDSLPVPAGKGRLINFEVTMSPVVISKPESMQAKLEIGGVSHNLRFLRFLAPQGSTASSDKPKSGGAEAARKVAKKPRSPRKRLS